MTRDLITKAIDDALAEHVRKLCEIYVTGLIEGTPAAELNVRFNVGLGDGIAMHTQALSLARKADLEKSPS